MTRIRRSALYLPASNARAVAKARTLPCDAVILDLEDAVAPDEKARARDAAVAAAREGGFGARTLVARANGLDTEWGAADLAALAGAGFDAILVPKIASAADVARYAALTGEAELWIMIETCASLFALEPIAAMAASTPLSTMVLGTNDLAKEMRARQGADRAPFLPFLSFAVAAARLHGLDILDGVYNAIEDGEGFAAACRQSVDYGCDGRTLIHPSQIAACNAAFAPDEGSIRRAQAIVAAFAAPENAGKGALRVDGAMAERLHLDEARRTIAFAEACVARG